MAKYYANVKQHTEGELLTGRKWSLQKAILFVLMWLYDYVENKNNNEKDHIDKT